MENNYKKEKWRILVYLNTLHQQYNNSKLFYFSKSNVLLFTLQKMASEEHLKLSSEIKNVHKSLRDKTKEIGAKEAWKEHLKSESKLKNYATAMKQLALEYWIPNDRKATTMSTAKETQQRNRILWSVNYCQEYFLHYKLKALRDREIRILKDENMFSNEIEQVLIDRSQTEKIDLLDVGSCFNPFVEFDIFTVTAVDIAPADDSVFECDFLNVDINDQEFKTANSTKSITQFAEYSFDVIVFSLLLEYLPTSDQRIICCEKAYRLLRTEGILIIITPDSKHVGANARLMKTWRYTLALIGFNRVKYEKLQHITCMVFRKSICTQIGQRWARMHKESYMERVIEIPQDNDKKIENNIDTIEVVNK